MGKKKSYWQGESRRHWEEEVICIAQCIDALENLREYYRSGGDDSDSVAIGFANSSTGRVLNYIISKYHMQPKD